MSDDQHLRVDAVQIAAPHLEPENERDTIDGAECDDDGGADDGGPLSLLERVVASIGAWASDLAGQFSPPSGPFFAADGRPAPDDLSRRLVIPDDALPDLDATPCP